MSKRISNLLAAIVITLVSIGILFSLFKKEHRKRVRTDFYSQSVSSIIESIYYYKDDFGSGIATHIKGFDVPFCFKGRNRTLDILYYDTAKEGDSIIKKSNSDSFYVKRNDSIFVFQITECQSR